VPIDRDPVELAREIARFFASLQPTSQEVRRAADIVRDRQTLLGRGMAGHACVVESLMRCALTAHLQSRYEIARPVLPHYVNSSHVAARGVCVSKTIHDHLIEDPTWKASWTVFQADHPEVNILVPGRKNPKRADIYVVTRGTTVSIEFKYVNPNTCDNLNACLVQIGRYVRAHVATVFVAYTALPLGGKSRQWFEDLRTGLASYRNVAVATATGPG
jgi:hypothetical protein